MIRKSYLLTPHLRMNLARLRPTVKAEDDAGHGSTGCGHDEPPSSPVLEESTEGTLDLVTRHQEDGGRQDHAREDAGSQTVLDVALELTMDDRPYAVADEAQDEHEPDEPQQAPAQVAVRDDDSQAARDHDDHVQYCQSHNTLHN